jgi:hypothetical protein
MFANEEPMNRFRLVPAVLAAALALSGCEGSETDRLERVQLVPASGPHLLAGGGASPYVAFVDASGDAIGENRFRLFRHDGASPDALVEIGGLYPADSPSFSDLSVSGDTAVLISESWGLAHVISLGDDFPALRWEGGVTSLQPTLAVAEGRWLLCAGSTPEGGTGLALVDLDAEGAEAEVGALATVAPVTGLLFTQGQFLAFTEAGYVHVAPDATSPVFTEHVDASIRGFRMAFADGKLALVAGPSIYQGQSRVARLDLSIPDSPVVLRFGDFAGEYGAFAWDGGDVSVLEAKGAPGAGLYQGHRIVEQDAGFAAATVSLPQWFGSERHVAAHAGRLFALDTAGMSVYRIH